MNPYTKVKIGLTKLALKQTFLKKKNEKFKQGSRTRKFEVLCFVKLPGQSSQLVQVSWPKLLVVGLFKLTNFDSSKTDQSSRDQLKFK